MNTTAELKPRFYFSKPLLWCSCIAFALCLLIHPQTFSQAASGALSYCLTVLVPALLPFIITGRLLYSAGFLHILGSTAARPISFITGLSPQAAAVFLLSLISGPPTGASLASKLYESGRITIREAERLIAVSSGVSPMYLAAGVGLSLMGDASFGFMLWAVQTLTSLLFAVLTADRRAYHNSGITAWNNKQKPKPPSVHSDSFMKSEAAELQASAQDEKCEPFRASAAISEAIAAGGLTMLTVCTTVIFFSCTGAMLALVIPDAAVFIRPLTELSSGLTASVTPPNTTGLPAAYIAFCCGFSGLAMIMQSVSEASKRRLSPKPLVLCRLLCAVTCAAASLVY